MKKSILFAILVSIFLVAGAYYYLFILNAEGEIPRKPTKMRVAVQAAVTSIKGDLGAKQGQPAGKTEMKQEVQAVQKKADPAKPAPAKVVQAAPAAKPAAQQKEPVKAEAKQEPKKDDPKKAAAAAVKEPAKSAAEAKKAPEKKVAPIRHYRVEFMASDGENAVGMRDSLIGKGYHTAKYYKYKGRHYVVVEPFTDKWEAQYVRDSIAKEIDAGRFVVKPVY